MGITEESGVWIELGATVSMFLGMAMFAISGSRLAQSIDGLGKRGRRVSQIVCAVGIVVFVVAGVALVIAMPTPAVNGTLN